MSDKTHITIVLDRSGSMYTQKGSVLEALNEFIQSQKKVVGKARISLLQFNEVEEYTHKDISLKKFPVLTELDYMCGGLTALHDAVGVGMKDLLEKEGKKVLVVQTDGYENASIEFSEETVKKMIVDNEKDVEVIFIGAGISTAQGLDMGMVSNKTMSVSKDRAGIQSAYMRLNSTLTMYRSGSVDKMDVSGDTSE